MSVSHYSAPSRFEATVSSRVLPWLVRRGVAPDGKHVLAVRGRKTGQRRTTMVNLLPHEGGWYLVSPRGETEWVRNLRADDGRGELRRGRRVKPFAATELSHEAKPAVLRAYLGRWSREVGRFFDGVTPATGDEELLRVAHRYPVLRVTLSDPGPVR